MMLSPQLSATALRRLPRVCNNCAPRLLLKATARGSSGRNLACKCELPGVAYAPSSQFLLPVTFAGLLRLRISQVVASVSPPRPRAFKCRQSIRSRPSVLDTGNCRLVARSRRPWYYSHVINMLRFEERKTTRGFNDKTVCSVSCQKEHQFDRQHVAKLRSKGHMSFKSSKSRNRHRRTDRPQREKGCACPGSTMFLAPRRVWRRSRSAGRSPDTPSDSLAICEPRALPPHLFRVSTATSRNRRSGEVAPLALPNLCSIVLPQHAT
jgi:hypothetical protein